MLCNTADTVERALRAVRQSDVVALDVETSGLDRWKTHIVGWVLTVGPEPQDTFYIPVRHAGGGNLPGCVVPQEAVSWNGTLHPVECEIARILSGGYKTIIGHNLQFDAWHSRRHGVNITSGKTIDTMISASLINEHAASFSLDACCRNMNVQTKRGDELYEYLAREFGGEANQKQMANYWRTNAAAPIVHEYAAGDGTSTWQLHYAQMEQINTGMETVFDIECRTIPCVHSIIWRGIKIDEERLDVVEKLCRSRLEQTISFFPSGFNVRAPSQMLKLFTDAGITDYPRTAPSKTRPNGSPSFNEAWLMQSELGRKVVAVRKYTTLLSSFVDPMKNKHVHDGRCHPWYSQSRDGERGTVTGRFSSSEPNQTGVPKRDKTTGSLFRSVFIPDDGKIWGSADLKGCEPTLLAHFLCHYNNNNALAVGYRQTPPANPHQAIADAAKIDYDSAKRLNQACATGAGKTKVLSELAAKGKSPQDAAKVYNDYFVTLPELRQLQRETATVYRSRGYIRTLLGRRCHLDDAKFDYKGLNRALQGGNADILKVGLVRIHEYLQSEGVDVQLLANIHDSIDVQFYEEDRRHYEECLRLMVDFGPDKLINLRVPMGIESGEGHNWAVATYGDKLVAD